MLTALRAPLAHDAVNLVDKYSAGLIKARQLEQNANQFFALSSPLGHD